MTTPQARGSDDFPTLVQQLVVATSALCEESREAEQLRLCVAAAKREAAAVETAAAEANACLAGKAFGTI
jgi:hypothetical protein